ncbi:hypothetical protein JYP46_21900 [Nitratireductor aquimarinus]|uniref:hypothetical protein n=1 Tax=Alphaproteobacteria TaxID=28211 RepID=UPI0019D3F24B|nr:MULTISPECIES: hypothetical protein [Alphaproteobacteria]MBN7759483.1 hypothetical protein [Nitratireductor aquimarinus]MBY6001772.1 hypothetical protein [Tritonibacter mobilis]MBY6024058.1 hypothetical protein [Nitratireductor sp. DP7N14-4]
MTDIRPASQAELAGALQLLFDALPFQRGSNGENVAAAYIEALRGVSLDAIKAGISRFLRGEVEGINMRFVPTPPELARIVRTTSVPTRIPPQRQIPPRVSMDEMARARMRLKMPLFSAAQKAGPQALDELAAAIPSFKAMCDLAYRWGVPVPDILARRPLPEVEDQWRRAHHEAQAEIERNPPPYLRAMRRKQYREAAE